MTLPNETIGRKFDTDLPKGSTLACDICGTEMPFEVLRSAAGYYLGFACPEHGPYSRESEYFRTHQEADDALKTGLWRPR